MVWAFDRALIQIDVARRQGRLRVAARILGRVLSIEPVELIKAARGGFGENVTV